MVASCCLCNISPCCAAEETPEPKDVKPAVLGLPNEDTYLVPEVTPPRVVQMAEAKEKLKKMPVVSVQRISAAPIPPKPTAKMLPVPTTKEEPTSKQLAPYETESRETLTESQKMLPVPTTKEEPTSEQLAPYEIEPWETLTESKKTMYRKTLPEILVEFVNLVSKSEFPVIVRELSSSKRAEATFALDTALQNCSIQSEFPIAWNTLATFPCHKIQRIAQGEEIKAEHPDLPISNSELSKTIGLEILTASSQRQSLCLQLNSVYRRDLLIAGLKVLRDLSCDSALWTREMEARCFLQSNASQCVSSRVTRPSVRSLSDVNSNGWDDGGDRRPVTDTRNGGDPGYRIDGDTVFAPKASSRFSLAPCVGHVNQWHKDRVPSLESIASTDGNKNCSVKLLSTTLAETADLGNSNIDGALHTTRREDRSSNSNRTDSAHCCCAFLGMDHYCAEEHSCAQDLCHNRIRPVPMNFSPRFESSNINSTYPAATASAQHDLPYHLWRRSTATPRDRSEYFCTRRRSYDSNSPVYMEYPKEEAQQVSIASPQYRPEHHESRDRLGLLHQTPSNSGACDDPPAPSTKRFRHSRDIDRASHRESRRMDGAPDTASSVHPTGIAHPLKRPRCQMNQQQERHDVTRRTDRLSAQKEQQNDPQRAGREQQDPHFPPASRSKSYDPLNQRENDSLKRHTVIDATLTEKFKAPGISGPAISNDAPDQLRGPSRFQKPTHQLLQLNVGQTQSLELHKVGWSPMKLQPRLPSVEQNPTSPVSICHSSERSPTPSNVRPSNLLSFHHDISSPSGTRSASFARSKTHRLLEHDSMSIRMINRVYQSPVSPHSAGYTEVIEHDEDYSPFKRAVLKFEGYRLRPPS